MGPEMPVDDLRTGVDTLLYVWGALHELDTLGFVTLEERPIAPKGFARYEELKRQGFGREIPEWLIAYCLVAIEEKMVGPIEERKDDEIKAVYERMKQTVEMVRNLIWGRYGNAGSSGTGADAVRNQGPEGPVPDPDGADRFRSEA